MEPTDSSTPPKKRRRVMQEVPGGKLDFIDTSFQSQTDVYDSIASASEDTTSASKAGLSAQNLKDPESDYSEASSPSPGTPRDARTQSAETVCFGSVRSMTCIL